MAKKTLLGGRIRRLRQDRGLTQAEMAARLGISPSYLNLIEHDQRPVTVPLLLKLGQAFDVDLQDLSEDEERRLAAGLREVFSDGIVRAHDLTPEEMADLARASPRAARAMIDLYRGYKAAREDAQALVIGISGGSARMGSRKLLMPTEEARDFFHDRTNHFPTLETAAEALVERAGVAPGDPLPALTRYLQERHGLAVEVWPQERMDKALSRLDPRGGRLALSEVLARSSRAFQVAYQLALLDAKAEIDAVLAEAELSSKETEALCRVGLANYFAGAVLMPYAPFLALARASRYDIEVLEHRFAVSFEQACHRLSTLQRPGAKGVPFWLVRVDVAGNMSKRFSAAGFHFSRFGGSCPRWVVHEAFTTPGLIRTQIARLPDGRTFFCLARTVARAAGRFREPVSHLAVGIGCEIEHAQGVIYADSYDLARVDAAVTEIGVGCRLCERPDCRQRAFPPLQHKLLVDEKVRRISPYAFRAET